MTEEPLPTQPEPVHIAAARIALVAVLAASPDFDTQLAAGGALAVLGDVHPPYPPLPEPAAPLPARRGVRLALDELRVAVRDAATAEEAVRAGLAARALRDVPPRS